MKRRCSSFKPAKALAVEAVISKFKVGMADFLGWGWEMRITALAGRAVNTGGFGQAPPTNANGAGMSNIPAPWRFHP